MKKDPFYDSINCELLRQTQLCKKYSQQLKNTIDGYLYIRENPKSNTYYQVIAEGNKRKRIKITDQPNTIQGLLEKVIIKKAMQTCRKNIKLLKNLLNSYTPLLPLDALDEKQRELFTSLYSSMPPAPYEKAPYDPNRHIHETVCGEMVSSKGEVIIVNALWHFDIPFNYEELFPYTDDDGNWFYPDFTIHCPDGTVIIWEHLGLLSRMDYCVHNAGKLHTYHENGYVIGKNLILTQDDNKGNCTTALAYHIIENYILPHFK